MGGKPAERCKSEALFLTEKARSWVISISVFCIYLCFIRLSLGAVVSGQIASNIAHIQEEIARQCQVSSRPPNAVMLLAVSKTVNVQGVLDAAAAGQRGFGENYVQEGVEKILAMRELAPELAVQLQWHLIGPLQSNKTRVVAEHFDWVHTIDRLKIAERLSSQRPSHLPPLQVLIQVNVDAAASKSGVVPAEILDLALAVQTFPHLRLRGLMSMPDAQVESARTQALHQRVHDVLQRINTHPAFTAQPLDVLSMGMSGDIAEAIAAGSTLLRVGTAIFGQRQYAA
jgi:hypothetical protein